MYTCARQVLAQDTYHYTYRRDKSDLTYSDVLHQWQHDAEFRSFHIQTMQSIPFLAYRWETPPVSTQTSNRPFEFVAIDAPYLERPVRRQDFAEHFHKDDRVADFPNLGGNAWLIVPVSEESSSVYTHLGSFTRLADATQQHALWQRVGLCMEAQCNENPLWLSTAGDGVAWLHVRIDTRPKYYHHRPYMIKHGATT